MSRPQGLLLDVGFTLLRPAAPVAETYAEVAARHGVHRPVPRVRRAFSEAFQAARPSDGGLRYRGDGRPFWRRVVAASVGSDDPALFEELYAFYGRADAWRVADGARGALATVRDAGMKVALVSDWDTRLRPLLGALELTTAVDHAAISCEVGHEKPDPRIFLRACTVLGLPPSACLHVGDDAVRDAQGARLAGCAAWVWGQDVTSFPELAHRLLSA
ncbi:MAG: HAD-IA family hydrolase [Alphaproteobacteria bacterium]|nr:HAD-IA family hydrolase [Alphaproteobacteria bacterium]